MQFKEEFPDLPARVFLQDLPHSIAQAFPSLGVENTAPDFFYASTSPTYATVILLQHEMLQCGFSLVSSATLTGFDDTGAKSYYLHAILQNQSPKNLRKLLENTRVAMTADSVLLIDEMVLPGPGVSATAASTDLTMSSSLASAERTKEEWRELLDDIGLEIVKTCTYNWMSGRTRLRWTYVCRKAA
jgi:hypothetical protein